MSALVTFSSKKRRLLGVAVGLAPVLACVICLAINPTLAIRALELALSAKRSGQKGERSEAQRDALTSTSKQTSNEGAGSCALSETQDSGQIPGAIPGKPEPAIAASFAIPRQSRAAADKQVERTGATKVDGAHSRANEHDIEVLFSVLELLKS